MSENVSNPEMFDLYRKVKKIMTSGNIDAAAALKENINSFSELIDNSKYFPLTEVEFNKLSEMDSITFDEEKVSTLNHIRVEDDHYGVFDLIIHLQDDKFASNKFNILMKNPDIANALRDMADKLDSFCYKD